MGLEHKLFFFQLQNHNNVGKAIACPGSSELSALRRENGTMNRQAWYRQPPFQQQC